MFNKLAVVVVIIILTTMQIHSAKGQIAMSNIDLIPRIKGGTTYVAINNPDSEKSKEFVETIKNTWKFSKLEFIKYEDVPNHLALENSFLTLGGFTTTSQFQTRQSNGTTRNGVSYSNTHIYLELWTPKEKFINSKKKNKKLDLDDMAQIARIELFTKFGEEIDPSNIYTSDIAGNKIRNWGAGILKNYIQTLNSMLEKKAYVDLYSNKVNVKDIKNLKKNTLYIPDYSFIKFNKFTGDESKKLDEKDLFEKYKFKYEVIGTEELNKKIMTSIEPVYYMIYIRSSTDKYVSVMNSKTGEMIYSTYSPISYNLKSNDLEDLYKKIQK